MSFLKISSIGPNLHVNVRFGVFGARARFVGPFGRRCCPYVPAAARPKLDVIVYILVSADII